MLRLIAFAALGALLGGIIVIAVGPPDIGYAVAGVARIEVTFSIGDDYGSTSFVAPADGSALTAR